MSSEDGDAYKPKYKRQKHSRACEFCRRRKVGCDAADNSDNRCSRCITYGIECQFESAAKVKRPTKDHRYVQALEDRLSKVEDLLKKILPGEGSPSGHSKDKEDERQYISRGCHRRSALALTSSSITGIFPRGFHPTINGTESSEDIDPSDDDLCHPDTISSGQKGYHGKSSSSDLVRTILNLKSTHTGTPRIDLEKPLRRITDPFLETLSSNVPPFEANAFPPWDLMHELIDTYFTRLNANLCLLHRPTFELDVKNGLHLRDWGFGAVLLLVCANGSVLSPERWQPQSQGPPPGYRWFELVTLANVSLIARPRLYDVQACALVAAYLNIGTSPQGCGLILSLGIRMAQDVGAHRKKMYSATPTPEQELWKRAFWVLIAMDRIASFALGRPNTINDEDFDLDPMTECDDEYWYHPDPSQAFKQPPGKPSKVAFSNALIRLLKIQATASRTIFTINKSKLLFGYVGPEWKQSIVAELDSLMNRWLDTVPSHLRWDPGRQEKLFFHQSAILFLNYYQLQISIHRQFIPSPRRRTDNPIVPSMAICVNAARVCVRILLVQHDRMVADSMISSCTFTLLEMPLFIISTMLGVHLWCGAMDAQATLEDFTVCLKIIKDFEPFSASARKLRAALEVMVPSASKSSGKGPRAASGCNLAKEGAQTIDEIMTVAMQSLRIGMSSGQYSSPEYSGSPATPAGESFQPPSNPNLQACRANSSIAPGSAPEQLTNLNELAYTIFSGCDMYGLEPNTILQDRPPLLIHHDGAEPQFAQDGPSYDATSATHPILTSEDYGFLDSLSSMFANTDYVHPNAASTDTPESLTFTEDENSTRYQPSDVGTLSMAAANIVPNPGDPSLWQLFTAPETELWNDWEAYTTGTNNPDIPPLS